MYNNTVYDIHKYINKVINNKKRLEYKASETNITNDSSILPVNEPTFCILILHFSNKL